MRTTKLLVLFLIGGLAAACSKEIKPPTAVAGVTQDSATSVPTGAYVRLDGSKSSDPNVPARPLFFSWRFADLPSGSHAQLNDTHFIQPVFQADVPGNYTVELTVSNGVVTSSPTQVKVTATQCGAQAPTAMLSVSPMESPAVGTPLKFGATVADPDNSMTCGLHQSLSWAWSLAGLPLGSKATLTNLTADLNADDAAPQLLPDVPGTYTVALVVTDSTGLSARATLPVTVGTCGANAPVTQMLTATPAQPAVGQAVQLTAKIDDADNDMMCQTVLGAPQAESYAWTLVGLPVGSKATLNSSNAAAPTLTPDLAGQYSVRLVVTDATGMASVASDLVITVNDCAPVVGTVTATPATPGQGQAVQLSVPVTANACAGTAPAFHYDWKLTTLPTGSQAALNSATASDPSFVADVVGTFAGSVTVTDGLGRSSSQSFTVTSSQCGATPPSVQAITATPAAPNAGELVQLSATVSDADNTAPCSANQTVAAYRWSFVSIPADSHAAFNDATLSNPSFVVDVPGDYLLALVVTDSTGLLSAPSLFTVTSAVCGSQSPTVTLVTPAAVNVGSPATLSALVVNPDDACLPTPRTESYAWSLVTVPPGSVAKLNLPTSPTPSLTPDVAGDYIVQLVVTDSAGHASTPAQLTLTAGLCGATPPSVTGITGPTTLNVGQAAQLTAQATDADTQAPCSATQSIAAYRWSLASLPAGSHAALNDPSLQNPSFTPDVNGTYTVALSVSDSTGLWSAPATWSITVSCGGAAPVVQSIALAPQNPAQSLAALVPVQLSAQVTDADNGTGCGLGQTFTYQWSLAAPAGSKAALNSSSLTTPSFIPDLDGIYTATLVVTDSTGRVSTPVSNSFTIAACGSAPVVQSATANLPNPNAGQIVTLTAVAAPGDSCSLSYNFTYNWSLVQAPTGSKASLNGSTLISPSFVADVSGTYKAQVTVSDQYGRTSAPAFVTVQAGGSCGNALPTASIYAPQTATAPGSMLTLTGIPTSADNLPGCNLNHTFAYAWSITSAPTGSLAQLSTPTSFQAGFIPDLAGSYTVSLVVTDTVNHNSSTAATVALTAAAGTGSCVAAPTVSTVSATPATAHVGNAISLSATGVSDGCGGTNVSYRWSFLSLPSGSSAKLNDATLASPSFTADVAGTYQFALTVTNSGSVKSTPVASTVSVDVCGGQAPVAIAGLVSPVPVDGTGRTSVQFVWPTAGSNFLLDGSKSYDPDNQSPCSFSQTLSYYWELLSVPAGFDPTNFGPANAMQPTLNGATAGTYQFRLRVSDGTNLSSPVYVTLSVYDNSIPGLNLSAGGWHRAYIDPVSGNPRVVYYDTTTGVGSLKITGCTSYCNTTTPVWSPPATIVSGIGTAPQSPPSISVITDSTDQAYASVLVSFFDSAACASKVFMCTRSVSSQSATGCLSSGDWPNNATLDSQSANIACNNNDGAYSSVKFQYQGTSNSNKSNYGYTVAYNETISGVSNLKVAVCTSDVSACFNTPSNLKKSYLDPVGSSFNNAASASAGLWPSLIVQPKVAGQPSRTAISYYSNGNAHSLRYTQCTAGCTTTNSTWAAPVTLDSGSSDVGAWSSAALDNAGRVHVSYVDSASSTLKYTRCSDLSCGTTLTPQVLDGPGNGTTTPNIPGGLTGGNTSIAVDGNNNPFISYFGTGYNPGPGIQYGGILRLASSSNGGAAGSWGASTLAVPSTGGATQKAGQANGIVLISPAGNARVTYWDASTGTSGALRTLFLGN